MKRHVLLALFRLLLALGVFCALPLSHARWGQRYPGDGQQAFGFIIIFFVIGLAAAAVFAGLGSLGQFLFRKRSARLTVFADLALFLVFAGVLVYGGVSARYQDGPPNNPAAGKAGIALWLAVEHHWPGLPEPGRSP